MMKFRVIASVISLIAFFLACGPQQKTLKFTKKPDEVVTTPSFKEFLKTHKNPKVVLRVNNSSYSITQDENIDYLFNAIENELLANGFIVRDRQLFNQIVGNDDNSLNYDVLRTKSDTDLIIELTALNLKVEYETNTYYENGNEKVSKYTTYRKYGQSIEFKVVLIESNEFAGVYRFNYTPCVDGCELRRIMETAKFRHSSTPKPFELSERNQFEEFVKGATRDLVREMRK